MIIKKRGQANMKMIACLILVLWCSAAYGQAISDWDDVSWSIVARTQEEINDKVARNENHSHTDFRGKKLPAGKYSRSFSFCIWDETSDISGCEFYNCDFSYSIGLNKAKKDSKTKFTGRCEMTGADLPVDMDLSCCNTRRIDETEAKAVIGWEAK